MLLDSFGPGASWTPHIVERGARQASMSGVRLQGLRINGGRNDVLPANSMVKETNWDREGGGGGEGMDGGRDWGGEKGRGRGGGYSLNKKDAGLNKQSSVLNPRKYKLSSSWYVIVKPNLGWRSLDGTRAGDLPCVTKYTWNEGSGAAMPRDVSCIGNWLSGFPASLPFFCGTERLGIERK